jgi:hypothetical protein
LRFKVAKINVSGVSTSSYDSGIGFSIKRAAHLCVSVCVCVCVQCILAQNLHTYARLPECSFVVAVCRSCRAISSISAKLHTAAKLSIHATFRDLHFLCQNRLNTALHRPSVQNLCIEKSHVISSIPLHVAHKDLPYGNSTNPPVSVLARNAVTERACTQSAEATTSQRNCSGESPKVWTSYGVERNGIGLGMQVDSFFEKRPHDENELGRYVARGLWTWREKGPSST